MSFGLLNKKLSQIKSGKLDNIKFIYDEDEDIEKSLEDAFIKASNFCHTF
jgi:hypothetical protein